VGSFWQELQERSWLPLVRFGKTVIGLVPAKTLLGFVLPKTHFCSPGSIALGSRTIKHPSLKANISHIPSGQIPVMPLPRRRALQVGADREGTGIGLLQLGDGGVQVEATDMADDQASNAGRLRDAADVCG